MLNGAQGGSRTRTPLQAKDFKSFVSAIPPPGRELITYYNITYGGNPRALRAVAPHLTKRTSFVK